MGDATCSQARRMREASASMERDDRNLVVRAAKASWIINSADIKDSLLILGLACLLLVFNRLFALINSLPLPPEKAWEMFLDCFGLGFFF